MVKVQGKGYKDNHEVHLEKQKVAKWVKYSYIAEAVSGAKGGKASCGRAERRQKVD